MEAPSGRVSLTSLIHTTLPQIPASSRIGLAAVVAVRELSFRLADAPCHSAVTDATLL